MQTVYDWVTMAIFCGLVVLFLERSVGERASGDHIEYYLPPCLACAFANYLGNSGQNLAASSILFLILLYIFSILKPFTKGN